MEAQGNLCILSSKIKIEDNFVCVSIKVPDIHFPSTEIDINLEIKIPPEIPTKNYPIFVKRMLLSLLEHEVDENLKIDDKYVNPPIHNQLGGFDVEIPILDLIEKEQTK